VVAAVDGEAAEAAVDGEAAEAAVVEAAAAAVLGVVAVAAVEVVESELDAAVELADGLADADELEVAWVAVR